MPTALPVVNRKVFRMEEDSLQHKFDLSRSKVQLYGGGFANGKTAGAVVLKVLKVAKDYPGANILVARSTYPKLNDTIRKEFVKWCPKHWIKSFPKGQNSSNTCTLKNGTEVNFRYIQQQGKSSGEATSSNLLSATYDLIVVDQMEDPEIVHKDFLDLLGRLRGMSRYIGDDETMPDTGPRWLVLTCNPTRNWVFRELVRPLQHYLTSGVIEEKLLYDTEMMAPIIDLFEGSTYENKANLEPDFIHALEHSYKGVMRERFLLGRWQAYEGLVYPHFAEERNCHAQELIKRYYFQQCQAKLTPEIVESYDHGLAVPSCYLFGFRDCRGNVLILDGSYEKEIGITEWRQRIWDIRKKYLGKAVPEKHIFADPQLFRRTPTGDKGVVGTTVARLFQQEYQEDMSVAPGVKMQRGNSEIINGIVKVGGFLSPHRNHVDPITGVHPSPFLYWAEELEFLTAEIADYYWKKDPTGDHVDKPIDKNDHAMDALKYMLTQSPTVAAIVPDLTPRIPAYLQWHESEDVERKKAHRYGRRN